MVDLSEPAGTPDTAFGAARAFWLALAGGPDYDAVAAHTRTATGQPAPRPTDEAGHMATAREILGGGVLLYGEIAYLDYRFSACRCAGSVRGISWSPTLSRQTRWPGECPRSDGISTDSPPNILHAEAQSAARGS